MRVSAKTHTKTIVATAAFLCLAFPALDAVSQTTRNTRVVVPFPAGGAADIMMRVLVEEIGRVQGTTMVIDNRPGASAIIGTEIVAQAPSDGYTLLVNSNSFVINPSLRKVTYDPLKTFDPVCLVAVTPMFVVVNASSPYRTLAQLLDAAKARPGELTLASLGPATAQHIAFELLTRTANVKMTFVPFAGNVPAVASLLGGHVVSALGNFSDVIEHVKTGKLRALATTSRTRVEALPEVPTVAESGFRDYGAEVWIGLVVPARTPPQRASQLAGWFKAAAEAPAVRSKFLAQGLFAKPVCGAEFGAYLRLQREEYARVIREANIKIE